jgi:hypothetical protein
MVAPDFARVLRILRVLGVVISGMPTDFRDGKAFPRRGRDDLNVVLWLKRLFDKARASADGTIYDYIYPCPMDQGVMERWGITADRFDRAIREHTNDDAIYEWLSSTTTPERIEAANRWLLDEKSSNLDRQDSEEGAATV